MAMESSELSLCLKAGVNLIISNRLSLFLSLSISLSPPHTPEKSCLKVIQLLQQGGQF